jgi:hypothetical protein
VTEREIGSASLFESAVSAAIVTAGHLYLLDHLTDGAHATLRFFPQINQVLHVHWLLHHRLVLPTPLACLLGLQSLLYLLYLDPLLTALQLLLLQSPHHFLLNQLILGLLIFVATSVDFILRPLRHLSHTDLGHDAAKDDEREDDPKCAQL